MRKAACMVMAAVMLLVGCAKNQEIQKYQPMLNRPFEMTGIMRQNESEFLISLTRQLQGSAQVRFEGPGSLAGMQMSFDAEQVIVDYEGLSFSFTPGGLPAASPVTRMLNAIDAALSDSVLPIQTENGILLSGVLEDGTFALLLDVQSGEILNLKILESALEFKPLRFQFLS